MLKLFSCKKFNDRLFLLDILRDRESFERHYEPTRGIYQMAFTAFLLKPGVNKDVFSGARLAKIEQLLLLTVKRFSFNGMFIHKKQRHALLSFPYTICHAKGL